MKWIFFIISWVQWDYWDVSRNMIKYISLSDLLFVEEISVFERFNIENGLNFRWKLIELNDKFDLNLNKKEIVKFLSIWKNIWIFESSWTACFIDPWYEIVEYIYELKKKIDFNIVPIPGTSALTLAISCSGFNIVNFQFLWFIHERIEQELLSSNITTIYFNQNQTLKELNKCIDFMADLDNMQVFVWINLWKIGVKNSNLVLRWIAKHVYSELNKLYNISEKLDDLTFIFK